MELTKLKLREILMEAQQGICPGCALPFPALPTNICLDHIDGNRKHHKVRNAHLLCRSCNASKQQADMFEWLANKGRDNAIFTRQRIQALSVLGQVWEDDLPWTDIRDDPDYIKRQKAYQKTRAFLDDANERAKEYNQRPEVKAYKQTEEYKARRREWDRKQRQKPHDKAVRKARKQTSEYKKKAAEYRRRPHVKEAAKLRMREKRANPETKKKLDEHMRAYEAKPEAKAKRAAYRAKPETKARMSAYYRRRKALEKYGPRPYLF